MSFKSVAGALRRVAGGDVQRDEIAALNAPLLSQAELAELLRAAQTLPPVWPHAGVVQHPQSGEFRSNTLGAGLDFEEARPYQPGDDVRRMDWRTTARTGKAFLKTFREEHQPQLHLVLDRGASMRFGTRSQLKVTQAARIAAMLAFISARNHLAIGATLWQPDGVTLPSRAGEAGVLQLVQAAIAPCPPLPAAAAPQAQTLAQVLRALNAQLPQGSRVVFIGDLHQFSAADFPELARLAALHEVSAYQVLDPTEGELPDVGLRQFADLSSGQTRQFDTHDLAVRNAFSAEARALHATQRALLARAGTTLHVCLTTDDLLKQSA
jgi:uncharacterized protein (DUF58 family)